MRNEEWKDLADYEGLYQISTYGRVKSLHRQVKNGDGEITVNERILGWHFTEQNYATVMLSNNGKYKNCKVHRLVASTFIPIIKGKDVINHKDGNKMNNIVDNLEWVTTNENIAHALNNGFSSSTLNGESVVEICEKYLTGSYTRRQLAVEYNVSIQVIKNITTKRTWNHITNNYDFPKTVPVSPIRPQFEPIDELEERWLPADNSEKYFVSNMGRIKNAQNLVLMPSISSKGTCEATFSYQNKRKTTSLTLFVAKLFVPNPHNYPYAIHKDRNKLNNRADNLVWFNPYQKG